MCAHECVCVYASGSLRIDTSVFYFPHFLSYIFNSSGSVHWFLFNIVNAQLNLLSVIKADWDLDFKKRSRLCTRGSYRRLHMLFKEMEGVTAVGTMYICVCEYKSACIGVSICVWEPMRACMCACPCVVYVGGIERGRLRHVWSKHELPSNSSTGVDSSAKAVRAKTDSMIEWCSGNKHPEMNAWLTFDPLRKGSAGPLTHILFHR